MNKLPWPGLKNYIPANKVLVLAPHMDDEIIGCGGSILKYCRENIHVSVVYTTLGNKDIYKKMSPKAMHETRKKEAEKSADFLGIKNLYFLDNDDSSDKNWQENSEELFSLLNELNPDLVYLPNYADSHPDHVKTNILFRNCCLNGYTCKIAAYEVWSLIFWPNILVNITNEMKTKLSALKEHKSQMKYLKYDKMCIGMNQYRAVFYPFPGIEYAEAFFHCTSQSYFNADFEDFIKKTN
jgi:LmbE family N-acetylglucosaminyl deacetylase